MPVPLSEATCGDPEALSVTVTAPVRPPVAVGVKVTFSEQVASEAREPPQFVTGTVTTAKSPLATTDVIVSVPEPVFVRMMLRVVEVVESVWSPKAREVGFRLTPGAADTPVPLTGTVCGEPAALSLKLRMAERAPPAVGVKITEAVQVCPGVVSVVQVVERAKSPGFVPVNVTLENVTVLPAGEVLVTVTVCDGLLTPTVKEPKVSEEGATETVAATGTVADASLERADSAPEIHAAPPVPVPAVELE